MSESKHTPGPWRLDRHSSYSVEGDHPKWGRMSIASAGTWSSNLVDGEELCLTQQANARLIAAAPEMLEALEALTRLVGNLCDLYGHSAKTRLLDTTALNSAKAAIKKARGSDV